MSERGGGEKLKIVKYFERLDLMTERKKMLNSKYPDQVTQ
jgi:hypothetical protein